MTLESYHLFFLLFSWYNFGYRKKSTKSFFSFLPVVWQIILGEMVFLRRNINCRAFLYIETKTKAFLVKQIDSICSLNPQCCWAMKMCPLGF